MNSRERVLAAIQCKPVDKAPFDFWAEPPTENRLKQHFKTDDINALQASFNVDVFHPQPVTPAEKKIGSIYQNFWGERYIYKPTEWGLMREDMPGALSKAETREELEAFDWPSPNSFDYSGLEIACSAHRDQAILYGMADIWQRPSLVRGLENALMDLALQPDWVHYLARIFTDFYKEEYANAFRASGNQIDIFLVISDLGGQENALISMAMFEEFVAPYLKEMTDRIHDLGAYAMFHSCGMVYPFISRLIELGVDILDPIQPVTDNMKPEKLAADFKGKICFHGGIDVQHVLPRGTTSEIEAEVQRYIRMLSPGYICCPSHLFQPDIPPENIEAFYRAPRIP
ncbi:MAG: hypothetical protein JXN60_03180 [Lentisphaerae bacterium]|nr:hypothetical protein [Lentisphaerota bacterium]